MSIEKLSSRVKQLKEIRGNTQLSLNDVDRVMLRTRSNDQGGGERL